MDVESKLESKLAQVSPTAKGHPSENTRLQRMLQVLNLNIVGASSFVALRSVNTKTNVAFIEYV